MQTPPKKTFFQRGRRFFFVPSILLVLFCLGIIFFSHLSFPPGFAKKRSHLRGLGSKLALLEKSRSEKKQPERKGLGYRKRERSEKRNLAFYIQVVDKKTNKPISKAKIQIAKAKNRRIKVKGMGSRTSRKNLFRFQTGPKGFAAINQSGEAILAVEAKGYFPRVETLQLLQGKTKVIALSRTSNLIIKVQDSSMQAVPGIRIRLIPAVKGLSPDQIPSWLSHWQIETDPNYIRSVLEKESFASRLKDLKKSLQDLKRHLNQMPNNREKKELLRVLSSLDSKNLKTNKATEERWEKQWADLGLPPPPAAPKLRLEIRPNLRILKALTTSFPIARTPIHWPPSTRLILHRLEGITDQKGIVRFTDLPSGAYRYGLLTDLPHPSMSPSFEFKEVQFDDRGAIHHNPHAGIKGLSGRIQLKAGETKTFQVKLQKPGTIRGCIPELVGLQMVKVQILNKKVYHSPGDSENMFEIRERDVPKKEIHLDSRGYFEISGLSSGSKILRAHGWSALKDFFWLSKEFKLPEGSAVDLGTIPTEKGEVQELHISCRNKITKKPTGASFFAQTKSVAPKTVTLEILYNPEDLTHPDFDCIDSIPWKWCNSTIKIHGLQSGTLGFKISFSPFTVPALPGKKLLVEESRDFSEFKIPRAKALPFWIEVLPLQKRTIHLSSKMAKPIELNMYELSQGSSGFYFEDRVFLQTSSLTFSLWLPPETCFLYFYSRSFVTQDQPSVFGWGRLGPDQKEIKISLKKGVTLEGNCVSTDGKPWSGYLKWTPLGLSPTLDRLLYRHFVYWAECSKGRFQLTGVPPGITLKGYRPKRKKKWPFKDLQIQPKPGKQVVEFSVMKR